MKTASDVYDFWFNQHNGKDWFGGAADFDKAVEDQFGETQARVAAGEGYPWRVTTQGRVAEIVVLDQFSRQLFRGEAKAFASDPMALTLAQNAVAGGHDQAMNDDEKSFVYMPYMHSESLVIHEQAVKLFEAMGNENLLEFEMKHKQIIERFGRYPKRNAALGRASTEEEIAYIKESEGRMF